MPIERRTQGFGTDVARVAKFVRADIAADKIAKALGYDDCGCAARAEALDNPDLLVNKIFYKKQENDESKEE